MTELIGLLPNIIKETAEAGPIVILTLIIFTQFFIMYIGIKKVFELFGKKNKQIENLIYTTNSLITVNQDQNNAIREIGDKFDLIIKMKINE